MELSEEEVWGVMRIKPVNQGSLTTWNGGAKKGKRLSEPLKAPAWSTKVDVEEAFNKYRKEDEEEEEEEERLHPHEIVAREQANYRMTSFSVMEGVGRTLKGRDLRNLRNAVWRHTGFMD